MDLVDKTWALVGPGAIGLNYSAQLVARGIDLDVLARSDFSAIRDAGIELKFIDPVNREIKDRIQVRPAHVRNACEDMSAVDVVVVAAKSTVNDDLVNTLEAMVESERTIILTLQNGMGNAEFFAQYFPRNPVLAGLCFVCANRVAPGVVENYLPGRVEIGSLNDAWPQENEAIVEAFQSAGIETRVAPVLDGALWRKLCWNIPFNGLAIAGGGITTDLILKDSSMAQRARLLMEEVRSVSAAVGYQISDKFIESQFTVTKKMGAYRPSSLIDFLGGRPVEVESIWGEPLRRGQSLDVAMPELKRLYGEISEAVEKR